MRLFLSCNELGLGHVNRITPLGVELTRRGHDLHFYSGGTAYQLLKKEFKNVYPCTPVAWYETSNGVIASASLLNILIPLPYFNHNQNKPRIKSSSGLETVHRYYDLRRNIKQIRPDLMISDGDIHALRLAQRWKIPSIYIANVIRPSYGFSPLFAPGQRFTERYVRKSTKILIPDNPEPYTISEHNLGNIKQIGIKEKTEFVGSFIDMTPQRGSQKHIFAPISGPYGTRAKLTKSVIPALRQLKTKSIVSLGEPGRREITKAANCEIHTWLTHEERQKHMKNATLIIFSGGHATCFETIKYAKPSVCIPTQPEQRGNAKKLQELKCSVTVREKDHLEKAIEEIEGNESIYRGNAETLSEYSKAFKGVHRAIEIIEATIRT